MAWAWSLTACYCTMYGPAASQGSRAGPRPAAGSARRIRVHRARPAANRSCSRPGSTRTGRVSSAGSRPPGRPRVAAVPGHADPRWSDRLDGLPAARGTKCLPNLEGQGFPSGLLVVGDLVVGLPNATLMVPQTATGNDGRVLGDVYVEIQPQDADYARFAGATGSDPRGSRAAPGPLAAGRRGPAPGVPRVRQAERRAHLAGHRGRRRVPELSGPSTVTPRAIRRSDAPATRVRLSPRNSPPVPSDSRNLRMFSRSPDAGDTPGGRPAGDGLRSPPRRQCGHLSTREQALVVAVHVESPPTGSLRASRHQGPSSLALNEYTFYLDFWKLVGSGFADSRAIYGDWFMTFSDKAPVHGRPEVRQ